VLESLRFSGEAQFSVREDPLLHHQSGSSRCQQDNRLQRVPEFAVGSFPRRPPALKVSLQNQVDFRPREHSANPNRKVALTPSHAGCR
jgi:hypothetical protein